MSLTAPRTLFVRLPLDLIPSANDVKSWNYGRNRWRLKELKVRYAGYFLEAEGMRGQLFERIRRWGNPADKIRLTVTRYCAREFDEDNLVGGLKTFIDSIKGRYVIDDKPSCLELVTKQVKGKERYVDVLIEEVF